MSRNGKRQKCETEEGNKQMRSWCDLPYPLLSFIADGLGLIDLLSFRGVCKDWRSASSGASAMVESLSSEPWFLIYGKPSHRCSLITSKGKCYTMNIPELDEGAICVSSYGGWLLLFKQGHMFFLCPFSRARIDLPKCPFSELGGLSAVAAFSSSPTSQDCTVALVIQVDTYSLEIYLLHCGDNRWVKHDYYCVRRFTKIGLATFHRGVLHIFNDSYFNLITFAAVSDNDIKCEENFLFPEVRDPTGCIFGSVTLDYPDSCSLIYYRRPCSFLARYLYNRLGQLPNVLFSISSCGTKVEHRDCGEFGVVILNDCVQFNSEQRPCPNPLTVKGVWIQPRFLEISSSLVKACD